MENGSSPTTTPAPDHALDHRLKNGHSISNGGSDGKNGDGTTTFPSASTTASHNVGTRARSGSASSHKRGLSSSLFSKLSLMRMSQTSGNGVEPGQGVSRDGDIPEGKGGSGGGGRAMASALQQQIRTRRRKGSLRKTALLGTGVRRMSLKSKRSDNPLSRFPDLQMSVEVDDKEATTRAASKEGAKAAEEEGTQAMKPPSLPVRPSAPPAWLHQDEPPQHGQQQRVQRLSQQPDNSRPAVEQLSTVNPLRDNTTTDDDDLVSFPPLTNSLSRLSSSSSISAMSSLPPRRIPLKMPAAASTDSYFSLVPSPSAAAVAATNGNRTMSQSHPRVRSPLATNSTEMTPAVEGWDYSETQWWGWIILLVTWVVFVVGMGSCLGVWSWAWDVGETPYAPPELEDDATLPIVGYYPALIILTAVMAWVWVVVAWVGMKYFRHANITG